VLFARARGHSPRSGRSTALRIRGAR
jgi:hypothetical protein